MTNAKALLNRMTGENKRVQISVAITRENRDWIEDLRRKTGLTPSAIVNEALTTFFDGYQELADGDIEALDALLEEERSDGENLD